MTKTKLTRTQLGSLEGVFHKGDPYQVRTSTAADGKPWFAPSGVVSRTGGARSRMVRKLRDEGYITETSIPSVLTIKGLEALRASPAAMRFIDMRDLEGRITKRLPLDAPGRSRV